MEGIEDIYSVFNVNHSTEKRETCEIKLLAVRETGSSFNGHKLPPRDTKGNVKDRKVFNNPADRHVCYFPLSLIPSVK